MQDDCDDGTEFTSITLDQWAYQTNLALDSSRPGKPIDNAFIESLSARLREECLNQHWFDSVEDVPWHLENWQKYHNNKRSHSTLGDLTLKKFARTLCQEDEDKATMDPVFSH